MRHDERRIALRLINDVRPTGQSGDEGKRFASLVDDSDNFLIRSIFVKCFVDGNKNRIANGFEKQFRVHQETVQQEYRYRRHGADDDD